MKALIIYHTNALEPAHSQAVKTAFIAGGGIDADIYLITNFNQAVLDYERDNNYDAIIYSYEGLANYLQLAINNPDIMIFMPTHSIYAEQIQQLVVTESLQDLQGGEYEFKETTQNKDSFSNGYICGQLFKIAELRNCSLQDARFLANKTKDVDGGINITSATNYQTEIFIDEPKEIEIEYLQDYQVKVKCDLVRDAIEYEYQILKENNYIGERERIIEFTDSEERFIKYRAIRGSNISNWSELFKIYPLEERRKKMVKVSMFRQVGVRRKEFIEDVPTEEGQIYVSKIENGVMQMVKKKAVKRYTAQIGVAEGIDDIILFENDLGTVTVSWNNTYKRVEIANTNILFNGVLAFTEDDYDYKFQIGRGNQMIAISAKDINNVVLDEFLVTVHIEVFK
ncbi:MAG: hypothetical protein IPH62_15295 [Ignavibacteriae bacterium]|nr:hypothetical protein [Ignavibacteriota bacterium]